jgi:dTDP-4-dehydrorhamnose reductase
MDLRAVTIWSLFGNVDWRFLLTQRNGLYDTGAFDARGDEPRPTIIAKAAKELGHGRPFDHPVLDSPGWWRRPPRLYPWNKRCNPMEYDGRKLLITGATGTLGSAFARICEDRALPYCLTTRDELDITDEASVAAALGRHRPWAIINTAGFVRVADAENEAEACIAANATGAETLARACSAAGVQLVTFSSDLVFDGKLGRPYQEGDPVSPSGVYGLSKAKAEQQVRDVMKDALIIRTSAFFGPWDKYNFAWNVLSSLARGEEVTACEKTEISPTYVPDLCHATLDLLVDGETGVWHLANQGKLSWYEFATRVAEGAGMDTSLVKPLGKGEAAVTALASERGAMLRPVDEALGEYLNQIRERTDLMEPAPVKDADAIELAAE